MYDIELMAGGYWLFACGEKGDGLWRTKGSCCDTVQGRWRSIRICRSVQVKVSNRRIWLLRDLDFLLVIGTDDTHPGRAPHEIIRSHVEERVRAYAGQEQQASELMGANKQRNARGRRSNAMRRRQKDGLIDARFNRGIANRRRRQRHGNAGRGRHAKHQDRTTYQLPSPGLIITFSFYLIHHMFYF